MYEKYRLAHFGRCPHVFCQGQPVLPVGLSDLPRNYTVNVFCPRCHGLFFPKSTRQANIDGAYFGTTFPHLYLMTHPVSVIEWWQTLFYFFILYVFPKTIYMAVLFLLLEKHRIWYHRNRRKRISHVCTDSVSMKRVCTIPIVMMRYGIHHTLQKITMSTRPGMIDPVVAHDALQLEVDVNKMMLMLYK